MNEALELAHKYGDESASSFINGILSNVLKEKKNSGQLRRLANGR